MIEFKTGDILQEDTDALVNTVNCVGVMGRGIALQFKKAFPDNFKDYAEACKKGEVRPGQVFVHKTGQLTPPRFIINFPTKLHWRSKSKINDIVIGLESLIETIQVHKIQSIAIPPLGCGLGGLDWNQVKPLIERAVAPLEEVGIIIFEPLGAPAPREMVKSKKKPNMTPGRAALIGLMDQYVGGLLDPFVTLLEVHKLMYFMQEAGEDLKLQYQKGTYGPYAENLRHVLHHIEGHYITGYGDGGDDPTKQLELRPNATKEARNYLDQTTETLTHFERVADLVEGFETPFGLELLSTVHWTIEKELTSSVEEITEKIHEWSDRKKQFTPRQINIAKEILSDKGWFDRENLQEVS